VTEPSNNWGNSFWLQLFKNIWKSDYTKCFWNPVLHPDGSFIRGSQGLPIDEFRFDRTIRSEKYRISDVRDPMSDEHHPNFGKNLSHLGRSPTRFRNRMSDPTKSEFTYYALLF
jgi:hypothetical protein